jgi:sensor histidine kinase regulating citrate/malate metabolism
MDLSGGIMLIKFKQLFKNPMTFSTEICLVLCIKIVLLYVLWALFFSHPFKQAVDGNSVAKTLIQSRTP